MILDGLIQNAGGRFQRTFADEPLLERLRLMALDDTVDNTVRNKCKELFVQWANAYSKTPGLERIAILYKELPKTKRPAVARQKVLQDSTPADPETEPTQSPFAESKVRSQANANAPVYAPPSRPVGLTSTSSGFSSKLFKERKSSVPGAGKPFNLAKEKENLTNALAKSSIASTNLLNGLQLIHREHERVSDNEEVQRRVEACRTLRRKILYYISNVESDKYIGSLINANEELVKALTAYEIMDRSISDDSDSDAWESLEGQQPRSRAISSATKDQLAGLAISDEAAPPKPPRPTSIPIPPPPVASSSQPEDVGEAEEDDDPFGDSNAVQTPYIERSGMTWREV